MRSRRSNWSVALVLVAMALCGVFAGSAAARGAAPKCTITGTSGPNVIHGTKGPDVICGGGGADRIYGLAGNDKLYGGAGPDRLYGGAGKDFVDGGPGKNVCGTQVGDRAGAGCAPAPTAAPKSTGPRPGAYCYTCEEVNPLSGPDLDAPVLRTIELEPNSVDTFKGPGTLTYRLGVLDFGGYLKGGSIAFSGPSGPWRTVPIGPGSDPFSNVATVPVEVPTSTASGRYEIAAITLEDIHGNSRTLTASQIQTGPGITVFDEALHFDVFAGPDTKPPTLLGLSLAPGTVDTSTTPATVDLSVRTGDDLAGVGSVYAEVGFPASSNSPGIIEGGRLTSGSVFDGVWDLPIPLAAHSPQGVYRIEWLALTDRAGNEVRYTEAELEAKGLPAHFQQTGGGDTTPPEILDFRIEPRTLSTSHGVRRFKTRMRIRDNLSGVEGVPTRGCGGIYFNFSVPGEPQGFSTSGRAPELVSGTATDGEWLFETELPADAPVGTYPITSVSATDQACNQTLLEGPALAAEPWDLSFENAP